MAAKRTAQRGAPRGHKRFSAIPPMPTDPRRELDILRDHTGPLGFLVWRDISDLLLWARCTPAERKELFRPAREDRGEQLAYSTLAAPELREPLRILQSVSVTPELMDANVVADACGAVVEWAEGQDMKETAVQFAEAAARLQPESSSRAYVSGRLCRRIGDHQRSFQWYWRAARLARRAQKRGVKGSEIDFANAHLGLGNLELDLGQFQKAERHYWKAIYAALRVGRRSLAGAGYHNLLHLKIATEQFTEAQQYAESAVTFYLAGHPRFPILAHDVALLWLWQGNFSSALPILEKVLPWVEHQRERILVLASLARCAAAVKDHIRYERAASAVLALAAVDSEMADSSLYHVAEGARSFWDWDRAMRLAERALQLAQERDNAAVVALARSLLDAISTHTRGDVDAVPAEGSEIDRVTAMVLQKLEKQPAPAVGSGAVPPEGYPTE